MKRNKRTIIIGLDGVPFGLLKDFSERGVMPNIKRLIPKGTFRKMQSSIPEVSSVAWSSIITGTNPGEHGIFGFTDFLPNTYHLMFPNFDNLKCLPFWCKNNKNRHIIINVPSTYPARELNGVLISGFVAPNLERAVYPDSLIPELRGIGYKTDVDSDKAHESLELFINDLNKINEARISAYKYFWDQDWDTFMFVFTGTDRLMHFLWDAYEDKNHDFHQEFKDYFRRIDEVVGEIISKMRDEDNFIMLSDHGFEKLENDIYINSILRQERFFKLSTSEAEDKKKINLNSIDYETKAFALDPARIYINLEDKYPKGSVSTNDKDYIIKDIKALFKNLEINGKKVIKYIYRKEEIYTGAYSDQGPDLVLIGNEGLNLKSSLKFQDLYSKDIFTGKHSQDNAFLLVNGEYDIIPSDPNVCDIGSVINQLIGESK